MENKTLQPTYQFLAGGGEMGQLIRSVDWAENPLGSVENWPQSLRTTLSIILHSKFPMFLFWGPELICFYNDAYRPSLGVNGKHPAALGQRGEVIWPEIWAYIKPLIDQVMGGGEATWSEDQLLPIYRNGQLEDVYWTFSYSPVNDESGQVGGVFVTCSETTGKVINLKTIEESKDQLQLAIAEEIRAREDQQKLLTLVENSVDLMSILELDGKNSYINKAGKQLLGIDDDQDVSLIPISDLHTPEQFAFVSSEIIPSVMGTGRWSGRFEARNVKTGEIIPLYNNCLRIDDRKTGLPLAVGAVMRDLRPEIAVQKALEESRERFRLLADFMPQFVWTSDTAGRLNYFNQSVYQYSGLSTEDIDNIVWSKIVHPDDRQANIEAWFKSMETGVDFVFQHRFRRYDGEYRWQLSRAVPMRDAEGKIQWWIGTSTDIDDQKKKAVELEQMVQQRTRELHNSNQELIKTNHELEQFAYIASHDLQEPLRKIQSFSELLLLNLHDQEVAGQYLNKISTSAQRMADLIKSVLNYSRLSNTADRFVETDLNQVLESVVTDYELLIEQKQARIQCDRLPVIEGVPMHLNQLFSNLIGNSLKFSVKDPHITISSRILLPTEVADLHGLNPVFNYVHIQFADNGIGFEPEYSERVFTIFQRLNHRKSYSGTGIGLALCRKIAESHQGMITAESELNNGARFHVYLPVKR